MRARPDSAIALAATVAGGAQTAGEIAGAALARAEGPGSGLRAFARLDAGAVRAAAGNRDGVRGSAAAPLAGVPVAIKDNLTTRGEITACGSRILSDYRSPYTATAVERLIAAGAVPFGKTNMDEFAMGSSTENSAFGPTRNPWKVDRVPGGSSGGSAAAVAAGIVPLALGSDTGGSVRQPAALCGVYGLKPTYGRVSRYGLIAFASSLDQVGGFARDPEDLALLYRTVAGTDPRDATCAARPVDPVDPAAGLKGLTVGLAAALLRREGVHGGIAAAVEEAARALGAAGAAVVEVGLPDPEEAIAAYYMLANAEASSNLARYDGVRYGRRETGDTLAEMYRNTRTGGFGAEVKRRILIGTYALSAGYYEDYYLRALRTREALRRHVAALFESCDLVLLPVTPTTAFRLGEKKHDPLAMYLSDLFTVTANLTGGPALSAPFGFDGEGLPVGVQLMAAPWREDLLFAAAGVLEAARPEPGRRPPEGAR